MLKQVILFLRVQETDYFILERFFWTQNHFVYVSFSCRFRVLWTYLLHNNGVLWWHIPPKLDFFFRSFWSFWTQNPCFEHQNIIILLFGVIFLQSYRNSEKLLVSELFPELKMTVFWSFQRVPFHKDNKQGYYWKQQLQKPDSKRVFIDGKNYTDPKNLKFRENFWIFW